MAQFAQIKGLYDYRKKPIGKRVYSKPIDLFIAQKALFEGMDKDIKLRHKDIAQASRTDAMDITAGTTKTWQLREENHPYSRAISNARGSRGLRRGLPINEQSGALRRAIRFRKIVAVSNIPRYELYVKRIKSAWVLNPSGTRKMIGRGFWKEIKKRWFARNKALKDFFRGI
jgi:hypothetical protein